MVTEFIAPPFNRPDTVEGSVDRHGVPPEDAQMQIVENRNSPRSSAGEFVYGGETTSAEALGDSYDMLRHKSVSPNTEPTTKIREQASTQADEARNAVADAFETQALPEPAVAPLVPAKPIERAAIPQAEQKLAPKFAVRNATIDDIPAIVEVDMQMFDSVYSGYDMDTDTLREQLLEKFYGRIEKIGGEWMPVLERDGEIVGSITCCPTNMRPEDFESWEKTTDQGTLEATYDPDGRNLYVVSLSVAKPGSEAKDMLIANQMGKMLQKNMELGFFESRVPGFKSWATKRATDEGLGVDSLTEGKLDEYADQYFTTKIERNGKQVPLDPLLRLYDRVGCKLLKIVPNAYQDEPSLNYGVVAVFDGESFFDGSSLPVRLPQNRVTRWMFGKAMEYASKSPALAKRLF